MKLAAFLFLIFFISSFIVLPADDPAPGYYRSAMSYFQNHEPQRALEDLNIILKSFPKHPLADDALLQIGIYYFRSQNQPEQALNYFGQIKENYADSDSAPGAYFYIAEIQRKKKDPASLADAVANYNRVLQIYPRSEWVADALAGAASVMQQSGDYNGAYARYDQVRSRFGERPVAAMAQFEMGKCSLFAGYPEDAALQFQTVVDRYPQSEYAAAAKEFNTILYRLYFAPPNEKRGYAIDSSFSAFLADLDRPFGLSIDSKNNLYLSDKDKKFVYIFDSKGKLTNSLNVSDPQGVSVDSDDRVLIANESNIFTNAKETLNFHVGPNNYIEEVRWADVDSSGNYYIVSGKSPGLLIYNWKREPVSGIGPPKTIEYYKVLINSKGEIGVLEKERKKVSVYGAASKLIFSVQPAGKELDFGKIEDFAFDRANHLYVLTENPRGILIFSPSGKLLRFISSVKNSALSFEEGKLITVGSSGAIYVLDKDSKRILKIG